MKFRKHYKWLKIGLLFILIGCSKNSIEKELMSPGSLWLFEIQKYPNSKDKLSANLVFRENGFVYEDNNRFLRYTWSINERNKMLIMNEQVFTIVNENDREIILFNEKSQLKATLKKIKK